jgi:undecaprenyl-diphosphatase
MRLFYFDIKILEWINHNRIKGLDQYLIFVTNTAYLTAALITIFIIAFAFFKKSRELKIRGWQLLFAFILNSVVITILKHLVNRVRPFKVDKLIEKLSAGGSPSFPSGHTADAFLIAISLTLLFSKHKWWLALVWIWAIVVAYSRMALGVHYPSDVLGSMVIGGLIAAIVNSFFKKNYRQKKPDKNFDNPFLIH